MDGIGDVAPTGHWVAEEDTAYLTAAAGLPA
jgi:hypothetical protein